MKKNLFLMAIATVTMLASCQKDDNSEPNKVADTKLKVRIANVDKSRAIGAPATASQITLNDGIIFILDASDKVTYKETINTTSITGVGQILAQQVTKNDKVYIVGNLTTELTTELNNAVNLTLDDINAKLISISSAVGQDYTKVTLANSDALSKAITINPSNAGEATVNVNIAPVYSRIELASVVGADNASNALTSFNVAGVYVTDYHLQYSLGGLFGGTIYEQKQSLDFTAINSTMKNEGTWSSTGTTPNITAIPEVGKSWVYNVPAGGLPRLIVKLNNVIGTMNSTPVDNKDYYVTLTGYSKNGTAITKMERAKIYRVEKIAFNLDQTTEKPNENQVNLTVKVTVEDWTIEVVDGEL